MEHSNLPPRSEDLIAGIVQAATESLPHQPDVLAKARALFGPLLDKLPLPSGESTLAHADGVAKIIAYIGGADNLQAVTYMLYAAEHLNRPQEVIEQAFGEEYATLAGFLMVMLRRVPRRTDSVVWGGYKFEVVDVDSFRVDQVMVSRLKPVPLENSGPVDPAATAAP